MFKPYVMKNVDLILGDEATGPNFKCQIRGVKLTPNVNVIRTKTACPTGQYSDVDDPEWTADLTYLYGDDDGEATVVEVLADFLLEHAGEELPFLFRPRSGGRGYSGRLKAIPGVIGGDYGQFSENTVSLPIEGQPVPVDAPDGP